ncbi:unnamed protein product [Prorocentrum cordatum]|uniref:Secreted protein n=1 Tax=Prorocentrum cordatum TaxID=2364126 RepID=A0ABN9XPU8_9DINO|nr:unnamed protein product [Polarella glacialis]
MRSSRTLCLILPPGGILLFLDAREDHLCAGYVLLRVDEEFVHVLVRPDDAGILVGLGVGEALQGSRLAAEDAPQRGALLGVAALLDRVALRALCLGELAAGGAQRTNNGAETQCVVRPWD